MSTKKRKGQRSAGPPSPPIDPYANDAPDIWGLDQFTPTGGRRDRKAKQICRQVFRTLDLVLSGECSDEYLGSLHVISVDPAPDAARLLVTVQSDLPKDQFDRGAILEQLSAAKGRFRTEIAATLNRRKTPNLSFLVMGSPEESARAVEQIIHPEEDEAE